MTTFGTIVLIYWLLNIGAGLIVIGAGGSEITPGGALLTVIIQIGLVTGLLLWGTGLGVL